MAKVIPHRETKAERKKERQKIGRLGDQKISPCTRERYHHSLKEVAKYVNLSPQMLLRQDNLDDILSSFVEMLWEDGESRSQGSYAIAAIQHFAPDAKGKLKNAWKLMGLWQKIEQPRRATPLDPSLLLAFAGVFWKWKWEDLACLTVVGFAGPPSDGWNVCPAKVRCGLGAQSKPAFHHISLWYQNCKAQSPDCREGTDLRTVC